MQMYFDYMIVIMAQLINTIFVALLMINNSSSSLLEFLRTPLVRTHGAANGAKYYALDFIGLVEQYGYRAESHETTTEDGYILTIFRIVSKRPPPYQLQNRPVVFMQHGMVGTADNFVVFGPNMSLAYKLSDAGYDVWFGNTRGNTYCRRHRTLTPNDKKFWDFSVDEQGTLDTPAMIDYVLNNTKQSSMTFIGYSIGSTIIAMLLSERPEYNAKINLLIALSPLYKWRVSTPARYLILRLIKLAQTVTPDLRYEVFFQGPFLRIFFENFCAINENIKNENLINFAKYWPAGTSAKVWYHLFQQPYNPGNLARHYDYESNELNLIHYGQTEPPVYNATNIVIPIVLFNGVNDQLVIEDDIESVVGVLTNAKVIRERLVDEEFGHLHYVVAKDMNKLITERLLEILDKFHRKLLF